MRPDFYFTFAATNARIQFGRSKMDNRRITLELELSGEVMEACAHLDARQVFGETMNAPGVSVCVVADSHPPAGIWESNNA